MQNKCNVHLINSLLKRNKQWTLFVVATHNPKRYHFNDERFLNVHFYHEFESLHGIIVNENWILSVNLTALCAHCTHTYCIATTASSSHCLCINNGKLNVFSHGEQCFFVSKQMYIIVFIWKQNDTCRTSWIWTTIVFDQYLVVRFLPDIHSTMKVNCETRLILLKILIACKILNHCLFSNDIHCYLPHTHFFGIVKPNFFYFIFLTKRSSFCFIFLFLFFFLFFLAFAKWKCFQEVKKYCTIYIDFIKNLFQRQLSC